MRSSATKSRDMARSILPSRARSTTAHLALTRRANRRAISQKLSYIRRGDRADQGDWDERSDLRAYPDIEIAMIVRWRRAADKLNHFERWAVEVTKPLPVEDRLGHMRAMLPGGLIGDHAMSHLRRLPELNPDDSDLYDCRVARWREQNAERRAEERRRIRSLVTMILEGGGHGALNAALKEAALDGERPRTLAGMHDVDGFLSHGEANDRGHTVDPRWVTMIETVARTVVAMGARGEVPWGRLEAR